MSPLADTITYKRNHHESETEVNVESTINLSAAEDRENAESVIGTCLRKLATSIAQGFFGHQQG